MQIGVNVPNFGPGTRPSVLRRWAETVEDLGVDLLMVSDHVAITTDVAEQYPAPFYEPFTTLSWLAGITSRVRLGTTVLIAPYRHPLLVARMAANLNELSEGRFVLGVGVGWAREEFAALGVAFERRGALTDELISAARDAWADEADYGSRRIPIWVGGNSDAGIRRAVRVGDAWHPLRMTTGWLDSAVGRLGSIAAEGNRSVPLLTPRIALRLTESPVTEPGRLAGVGTIDQVVADLEHLRALGSDTVVLDPFNGDPSDLEHPDRSWRAIAAVLARWSPTDRADPAHGDSDHTDPDHAHPPTTVGAHHEPH